MSDLQVIPQTSIDLLQNGEVSPQAFDSMYGEGSSERALEGPDTRGVHDDLYDEAAPTRELSTLGKVWDNTVGAVVYGAQEAFNETVDSFESFDEYYGTKMEEWGIPAYLSFTDGEDGGFGVGFKHRSEIIADGENVAFFGDPTVRDDGLEINAKNAPQHWTGQLVGGVAQFAVGYGAAKRVTGLTGYLGMFANGALADALAFDPDDANLTRFVEDLGVDTGTFGELMATDPDDPEWQNRLRNAAEGAVLGAVVEVAAYAVRARRLAVDGRRAEAAEANRKAIRASRAIEQEIKAAGKEVVDDALKSVEIGKKISNLKFDTVPDAAARTLSPEEVADTARYVGRMEPLTPAEVAKNRASEALMEKAAPKEIREGTSFYTEASMKRAEGFLARMAANRQARVAEWRQKNSWARAEAMAGARLRLFQTETGIDPEAVLESTRAGFTNKEEMTAHLFEWIGGYMDVVKVNKAMREVVEGTKEFDPKKWKGFKNLDEFKSEYVRRMQLEHQIAVEISGAKSSGADFLNAQKNIKEADALLEQSKKLPVDPNIDPVLLAKTTRFLDEANVGRSPENTSYFYKKLREIADLINTYRINALLSGVGTQEVNLVSNLINSVAIPAQEVMGGGVDVLTGKGFGRMRHGLQTFRGQVAAVNESLGAALRVWDEAAAELDPFTNKVEDALADKFAKTGLGKTMQLPTRLLMVMDELFKQASYRGRVFADADEMARMKGLSGKDRETFLKGYIADSFSTNGQATRREALLQAQRATFTEPLIPNTIAADFQNWAIRNPAVRFVAPFIRTPVNILSTALQHVPVAGRISKRYQADIAAGGARAAQARGKQMIGGMLIMSALLASMNNHITGAGPTDPRLRKVWLANNRPYSIKFPQEDGTVRWVSYARYEPMAQLLAIVADYKEIINNEFNENDLRGPSGVAWAITMATLENSVNKTFTQGIYDFTTILSGRDESAKERALNNMVGSFVPNLANQMNGDPAYREARTLMDAIWVRGPEYDRVDVRRNVLGEVVYRPLAKTDPLSLMTSDVMEVDPVLAEMDKVGREVQSVSGHPSKRLRGVELTEIEYKEGQSLYDHWIEKTGEIKIDGKNIRQQLESLFKTDEYQFAPIGEEHETRGTRAAMITKVISTYRRAAKESIPELVEIERAANQNLLQMHEAAKNQRKPKSIEEFEALLFQLNDGSSRRELFNN